MPEYDIIRDHLIMHARGLDRVDESPRMKYLKQSGELQGVVQFVHFDKEFVCKGKEHPKCLAERTGQASQKSLT